MKREVLVCSVAPGPFVGAGRHTEAVEGRIVPDVGIRQSSAGDIAYWHDKGNKEAPVDANAVTAAAVGDSIRPAPELIGPWKST